MMKNKFIKFFGGLLAIALVVAPITACGSSNENNSGVNDGSYDPNGIVNVRGCEPESGFIPSNTQETCGGNVLDLIYSKLVDFDDKNDSKLEMDDAKDISVSDDGLVYTVKLKEGRKFSDGSDVKAENYVKAWNFGALSTNAQFEQSFYRPISGFDEVAAEKPTKTALSGLNIVSDYEFTIRLTNPDSAFRVELGSSPFAPLPDTFISKIKSDGTMDAKDFKSFGENPIGNGPYVVKSWVHDQSIELIKNPNYKGDSIPENGGINYKIYTDSGAAYADIQSGALDVSDDIPTTHITDFETDSTIQSYNKESTLLQTMSIPAGAPHFGFDEEGKLRRQAISMSINREEIIDKIFNKTKSVPTDFSAPGIDGHNDNLAGNDVLSYNPTKAKELWEQADKISKFTGKFQLATNTDSSHSEWVNAVCNQIKNTLGIDASIFGYPTFTEFLSARKNIKVAFRSGWQADYPFVSNYLLPLYTSAAADGKGSNDSQYKNTEFDNKCVEAEKETSLDAAVKKYDEAQEILFKDLPAIPLWNQNAVFAFSKNVNMDTVRVSYKSTLLLRYLRVKFDS